MGTDTDQIRRVYEAGVTRELQRLARDPVRESEWALTRDLIDEYIECGSDVADIGAGPGRYAEYLLGERNCRVGVTDLSQASLDAFAERTRGRFADRLLFNRASNATQLGWIADESLDGVLLMGPLYHLVTEAERAAVVAHCFRCLRPGGHVLAAFLSPWSRVRGLLADPSTLGDVSLVERLMQRGVTTTGSGKHRMEQYRAWPADAKLQMERQGFETLRVRSLEGLASSIDSERLAILANDEDLRAQWFRILRGLCELPEILGATWHFLYVGRRPAGPSVGTPDGG